MIFISLDWASTADNNITVMISAPILAMLLDARSQVGPAKPNTKAGQHGCQITEAWQKTEYTRQKRQIGHNRPITGQSV